MTLWISFFCTFFDRRLPYLWVTSAVTSNPHFCSILADPFYLLLAKRLPPHVTLVFIHGFTHVKFFLFVCLSADTKSIVEHTHSADRRLMLIKTDKTERSTRHWSRRNHRVTDSFCNCIEDRTI